MRLTLALQLASSLVVMFLLLSCQEGAPPTSTRSFQGSPVTEGPEPPPEIVLPGQRLRDFGPLVLAVPGEPGGEDNNAPALPGPHPSFSCGFVVNATALVLLELRSEMELVPLDYRTCEGPYAYTIARFSAVTLGVVGGEAQPYALQVLFPASALPFEAWDIGEGDVILTATHTVDGEVFAMASAFVVPEADRERGYNHIDPRATGFPLDFDALVQVMDPIFSDYAAACPLLADKRLDEDEYRESRYNPQFWWWDCTPQEEDPVLMTDPSEEDSCLPDGCEP